MRTIMLVAVLALGIGGCNQGQRQALKDGAQAGAAGEPAAPPRDVTMDFILYMAAYLVGTSGKEAVKGLAKKLK